MKRVTVFLFVFLVISCGEKLPIEGDLSGENYAMIDHFNNYKNFPSFVKNKVTIAGYIFTNCPDICPLTTNNMRLIQEKLNKEKITDVNFVTITFDPAHDSPEVLRHFAEVRNLELSNWTFLTGEKTIIDSLMKRVGVFAVIGDSTVFNDGRKIYYYVHTDRIQLFDQKGRIRKNYIGSDVNIDEVISDIKLLL